MSADLKREFLCYLDQQEELLARYKGKFIVMKDCKVIGAYDSELEAVRQASEQHELGTFLVQKCEPGTGGYTQTYHSRVAWA